MSEIEDVVEYHADGTITVRNQPKKRKSIAYLKRIKELRLTISALIEKNAALGPSREVIYSEVWERGNWTPALCECEHWEEKK
jgi:hypothetical protein